MAAVDFASVPVVDLRSNPAASADALHRAATEVGFFYVIGHDVSNTVIEAAYAASEAFFALPAAAKRSVQIDRRHRGFIEIGEAKMYDAAKPDLKESFIFGLELPESDPDVVAGKPLMGPNRWPDRHLPELRPVLTTYYDAVCGLGRRILALMEVALELPAGFFAARYRKPLARGSVIYYPPQPPSVSDPRYGVSAHTDYGCITILSQDMTGGLEVRNRAGEWIAAPPRPDGFIINIGDLLARWTNDRYASTPHRVVNRSGRARYSIALFYDPDVDTPIETLASCRAQGVPSRYPPTTCGTYITERFDQAFAFRNR
jgi:isopenicillin N synthase-like dioxygenase